MNGVIDRVEGLVHIAYDDIRTCCGLWFAMFKKGAHKIECVLDAPATCLVCACWQPEPLNKPLWRPPEWE